MQAFICIVPHRTYERWIFLAALVFWEPNCDPGRFEVMLDAMKRLIAA